MKKNAVITGGSRGLGLEIASGFARELEDMESITLIASDMERLEQAAAQLSEINRNVRIEIISNDLSGKPGIKSTVNKLKKKGISYNILINNAGYGEICSLEEASLQEIEKTAFVNLIAPMILTGFILPVARSCKWGRIINIASIAIFAPNPMLIPYTATKSGLKHLSELVTLSDMRNGITCNTICPGLMLTDMGKFSIKHSYPHYDTFSATEIEHRIASGFPAGRITETGEVAELISFLVSDKGGSISGEFFRVASGLL